MQFRDRDTLCLFHHKSRWFLLDHAAPRLPSPHHSFSSPSVQPRAHPRRQCHFGLLGSNWTKLWSPTGIVCSTIRFLGTWSRNLAAETPKQNLSLQPSLLLLRTTSLQIVAERSWQIPPNPLAFWNSEKEKHRNWNPRSNTSKPQREIHFSPLEHEFSHSFMTSLQIRVSPATNLQRPPRKSTPIPGLRDSSSTRVTSNSGLPWMESPRNQLRRRRAAEDGFSNYVFVLGELD